MVLVSGEPGQGKTTLVAEAARSAHEDGMIVLWGRCDEGAGAPYAPFAEALTHYVAHADEQLLRAHIEGYGGELARLVPTLAQRVGPLPAPGVGRPRHRALPAARRCGGVARRGERRAPL